MIGQSLKLKVLWYDKVPEPPIETEFEGEVVSWRTSQIVVRVKGYAVLRFWKRDGKEVNNKDHERRGFVLAIDQLNAKGEFQMRQLGIKINMENNK